MQINESKLYPFIKEIGIKKFIHQLATLVYGEIENFDNRYYNYLRADMFSGILYFKIMCKDLKGKNIFISKSNEVSEYIDSIGMEEFTKQLIEYDLIELYGWCLDINEKLVCYIHSEWIERLEKNNDLMIFDLVDTIGKCGQALLNVKVRFEDLLDIIQIVLEDKADIYQNNSSLMSVLTHDSTNSYIINYVYNDILDNLIESREFRNTFNTALEHCYNDYKLDLLYDVLTPSLLESIKHIQKKHTICL